MEKNIKNNNFQLITKAKKEFEVLITIPWEEIKKIQEEVIAQESKTTEIKGFRKGKAPLNLVKEKLGPQKLLEKTLEILIPNYYQKAINQFQLKPILAPRLQLVSVKEKEDWQIKFISCEEPDVDLNRYKEELRKLKVVEEIWTPNQKIKDEEKNPKQTQEENLNQKIDWLLKNIKVEICDLLLDEEVTRRLSDLIDQTQKLGITVEQYLASTGKTVDQIKEEYRQKAQENLAIEFILGKIADEEKIEVKPEEIEKLIAETKNEEERKALESQKYLLATLIRRQKTLDFLASL